MENFKFFGKIEKFSEKLNFFGKIEKIWKNWQILKSLKIFENFYNFFQILNGLPGWFNRLAWLANPVFWGPGLCCSWPAFPDCLQWALSLKPSDTYNSGPKNRSKPLDQPLRISKGWREEVWVRGVEFSGSLRHLLGTS